MRTRIAIGGALASAAVLVGAWEAGQTATTTSNQASSADANGTGSTGSSSGSSSTGTNTPTATPSSGSSASGSATSDTGAYKDGTFTGSTISTRYGDVQVSVTIASGKITAVTALHLTDDDGRSMEISAQAAPLLEQEVLDAQSAQVDTIGGATYTSDGYLQSLQAALDQAT